MTADLVKFKIASFETVIKVWFVPSAASAPLEGEMSVTVPLVGVAVNFAPNLSPAVAVFGTATAITIEALCPANKLTTSVADNSFSPASAKPLPLESK